jgi:outer membrane protein, multidrug efflux system
MNDRSCDMRYVKIPVIVMCAGMLAICGCMVGPDFHKPQPQMPEKYYNPADANAYLDLTKWWGSFGDPNLTSLVDRAIVANLDLKQAQTRVREARASLGITESGLWPSVNASGSGSRSRTHVNDNAVKGNSFRAGLDAAWELDVFGGTRRSVESAQAQVTSAQEELHATLVTLTSEVALNYINLRAQQEQLQVTRDNLVSQEKSAEITRKRYGAGFVSALDTANADILVVTTRSGIPQIETQIAQTIYALSVLLGQEPAALEKELSPAGTIPVAPPDVPAGLPSELLRRRPDIRLAEAQLHAATANIGVAVAEYFPTFSLTGSAGYQSDRFRTLVRQRNSSWSYGAGVNWELFSAGRISSNVELQKQIKEETLLSYQKTILTALQDVENALIAYQKEKERRQDLVAAVTYSRKSLDLSTQLYTEGETDYLNVLVAQRALLNADNSLVSNTQNLAADVVQLYKALGGGWDEQAPAETR